MTKKEYFNHATVEEQKEKIRKWFLNNYEDPANCCPYEDGEYQYIWGGPYEPREVIEEYFGDYVSEKIMKKNQDGNVYSYMGCRSLLPVWKDENGKPKFEGRLTLTVGVA